jgi:hypothetical protein
MPKLHFGGFGSAVSASSVDTESWWFFSISTVLPDFAKGFHFGMVNALGGGCAARDRGRVQSGIRSKAESERKYAVRLLGMLSP